jgi:hypothetical protein
VKSFLPLLIASLSAATAACASSAVVARKDASFDRAQARMTRTASTVELIGGSEAERSLFLQAEGFYRYRFDFPPRQLLSYLAQGAAAITDLPALQSLAGSLDLVDVRLRGADSAIHLWETLLARHPDTPLKSFALYRLGWAYRSAGASGLPRESGGDAFDALDKSDPHSAFAALSAEARKVESKSKGTGTAFSIVPGLGQMYVGEYGNGILRLAVALASVAMIVAPVAVAYDRRQDLSWGKDWPLLATGLGGLVLLSIDYTSAYQDAMRGVVEFNETKEAEFEDAHPDAP